MDTHTLNISTLYEALKHQVNQNPDQIIIVESGRELTAKDFLHLVDQIAAQIPSEENIGVVLDHQLELIAALFTINKVGSTFVPVEPDFPDNRIQNMFDQAEVKTVLSQKPYLDRFNEYQTLDLEDLITSAASEANISEVNPDGERPAYILFTSGTTGNPKGVVVRNRNVLNYVNAFQDEFNLTSEDRMLQNSVVSFDIFVEEVFASLLNGASLAIASPQEKSTTENLNNFIEKNQVTMLSGFPYLLEQFNLKQILPSTLRLMISGGDTLRGSHVDWLADKVQVYNTYGPSETTVCATYFPVKPGTVLEDGTYPIGHPVRNVQVQIRKEDGSIAAPFEAGEIWISGEGVSAGYKRPVEESSNFILVDRVSVYKTGDKGYQDDNGQFYFLGREDRQVMIDGRRVELSELENVLSRLEGITQVYVHSAENENKRVRMTAFYSGEVSPEEVGAHLKKHFPAYMIPGKIVRLETLPLNDHGKVDTHEIEKYL